MGPLISPEEISKVLNEALEIALLSIRDEIRASMNSDAMCNGFDLLVRLKQLQRDLTIVIEKKSNGEDDGPRAS